MPNASQVKDERVLGVQPLPAGRDLGSVTAAGDGNLGGRRRTAEIDEARVGQVAQCEVVFIHRRSGSIGIDQIAP
jgi:hypothetical protein